MNSPSLVGFEVLWPQGFLGTHFSLVNNSCICQAD